MSVNHGEAFVAHKFLARDGRQAVDRGSGRSRAFVSLPACAMLLLLSGCLYIRRVPEFNQRQYDQCVEKHGGETWYSPKFGMTFSCRAQVWHCKPDGTECSQVE